MKRLGEYEEKVIGFTNDFCPPELHALIEAKLNLQTIITQKMDAFAFGLTFYEMLLSEYKIPIKRIAIRNKELLNNYLNKMKDNLKKINAECLVEILENCASLDPKKRKTFTELFDRLASILSEIHKQESIKRNLEKINYLSLAEKYEKLGDFETASWFYEQELRNEISKD